MHHIVQGIERFGPVYGTWMFPFERFNSWMCQRALNRAHPEATINIGYTMEPRGLRDLEPRGNRYRHPRAKRKGVYRFPRGSKSCRPRGFHRIRSLYYTYCDQSNQFPC